LISRKTNYISQNAMLDEREDILKNADYETRIKFLAELIMKCRKQFIVSSAMEIAEFATPRNLPLLSLRCDVYETTDEVMGAYVQIRPHMKQMKKLDQDPLHVLLVIDVSGSMQTAVTTADKEEDGFTILDIVKHAACTVVESLSNNHTVTLISFSNRAKVIFCNLAMGTSDNKKTAHDAIKALSPQGATNLWEGLRNGLECIKNLKKEQTEREVRTRSEILIFTDGMPNRNPSKGIMNEFRDYAIENEIKDAMFTIRTFGFGYSLDSELLENLAKYGRGTFNFIPDASFVGTIFIHCVADMLSGVPVKDVRLFIDDVRGFKDVNSVEKLDPNGKNYITGIKAPLVPKKLWNGKVRLEVPLGNVGSGQIKDVLIKRPAFKKLYLTWVDCRTGQTNTASAKAIQTHKSTLKEDTVAACELRTAFCDLLSKILTSGETNRGGYQTTVRVTNLKEKAKLVEKFIKKWARMLESGFKDLGTDGDDEMYLPDDSDEELSASDLLEGKIDDTKSKPKPEKKAVVCKNPNTRARLLQQGILSDLKGQVTEAVSREDWFKRWGIYYIRSLRFAHQTQYKNNFKDEGIKQYGGEAFINEVERVNKVFDSLPAPKPSARRSYRWGTSGRGSTSSNRVVNMSAYNNSSGPCFGAETLVLVPFGQGAKLVPCSELRKGDAVVTGKRGQIGHIRCVIESTASDCIPVLSFEGYNFTVTPWHPVNVMGKWSFPAEIADESDVGHLRMVSRVFNFILEEGTVDHTILLNGRHPSVLLGHGQTDEGGVLNHAYFANYERVVEDLSSMRGWNEGYVKLDAMNCLERDPKTGRVNRLVGPPGFEQLEIFGLN